jgi:hypothetical protein
MFVDRDRSKSRVGRVLSLPHSELSSFCSSSCLVQGHALVASSVRWVWEALPFACEVVYLDLRT